MDFVQACDNFHVKMLCSGGAETASPADSDPLGFSVDAKTGAITGTPQRVRDGYKMRLRAVDADDTRTTVAEWTFDVESPPVFALNPSANWSATTDGTLATKYHVSETHLLRKPRVQTTALLQHPANGDFDKVVYLLSVNAAANNPSCAVNDTEHYQCLDRCGHWRRGHQHQVRRQLHRNPHRPRRCWI